MPQFTVLIPAFNRAALLAAALNSVAAQTFHDFEVIVVDDGSTDATSAIAQAHPLRPRVLRQENAGPGAARNLGIAHAVGRYVAFLDSDDAWLPWTLATYDRAIRENQFPVMVGGEGGNLGGDADALAVAPGPYKAQWFPDFLAAGPTISWLAPSGVAVRTEALRAVGGFSLGRMNLEDMDLWMRLGAQPGLIFVSGPQVFARRLHDQNVSLTVGYNAAGLENLIDQERAGKYPGGRPRRHERHVLLCSWVRAATVGCLCAGHVGAGLRGYRRSFLWQLGLGRWYYLMGFPVMTMMALLRRDRREHTDWNAK